MVEQLKQQRNNLRTPDTFSTAKFTADSGFHSEVIESLVAGDEN